MTRAIRDAMAVSVAMLALSAGGIAHAGTRGPVVAPGTAPLERAFFLRVPDTAPVDLTRIDADEHPRTVHPGIVLALPAEFDYTNQDDIDVIEHVVNGTASAVGLYGAAVETTTLRNYGDVSVSAESVYGDAAAYGALEYAGGAGIGLMINGGDIQVDASAGAGMRADATGINIVGDVASIFNDGSIGVAATAGDGGLADARAARSYGSYTNVSNYGSLIASATADGGTATARGADSLGLLGSSVYNAGDIQARATADGGEAIAFGSYSVGINYGAYANNLGTISAHAIGDSANAYGALTASAYYGNAITTNAGDISAIAEGGIAEYGEAEAIAFGAYSSALVYDAVVDNSGTISATALAMADISGTDGFLQAKAVGAESVSTYGYGDAVIANSGAIEATAMASQGYASAWGAAVQSSGQFYGASLIDNDGAISAYAYADIGVDGCRCLRVQSGFRSGHREPRRHHGHRAGPKRHSLRVGELCLCDWRQGLQCLWHRNGRQ